MPLETGDLDPDPLRQFHRWWEVARAAGPQPFTPMVLATADGEGRPSARYVLLKGVDDRGFAFYTNYRSRKGRELAANPHASLAVRFLDPHRQVVVSGQVAKVPEGESDAYFATRPRGSQLAAWASEQSEVLTGRDVLEASLAAAAARYPEGGPVPRPPGWGGYVLRPDAVELWQEGPDRLHDRFRYARTPSGGWSVSRLAP